MAIINIYNILGNNRSADTDEKGEKIFSAIQESIKKEDRELNIDFSNIELINTAFLNNGIGKIYSLEKDVLKQLDIKIMNFPDQMKELLGEVIKTAKDKYLLNN